MIVRGGSMSRKYSIAPMIKQYRKDYSMTQKALGEELGVSYMTIKRWENGTHFPNLRSTKLLEEYFDVPLLDEYAMYKGDVLQAVGTLYEISELLELPIIEVLFFGTPHYAGRSNPRTARRLIKLEEETV